MVAPRAYPLAGATSTSNPEQAMKVHELINHLMNLPREASVVVDISAHEVVDGHTVEMRGFEGDRVVRGISEVMTQNGTPFVHIMAADFRAEDDCANLPWVEVA